MVFDRTPDDIKQSVAADKEAVRILKENLYKEGARWQWSGYGTLQHKDTGEQTYVRIEVMSFSDLSEPEYVRLKSLFALLAPREPYSLWTFRDGKIRRVWPARVHE